MSNCLKTLPTIDYKSAEPGNIWPIIYVYCPYAVQGEGGANGGAAGCYTLQPPGISGGAVLPAAVLRCQRTCCAVSGRAASGG